MERIDEAGLRSTLEKSVKLAIHFGPQTAAEAALDEETAEVAAFDGSAEFLLLLTVTAALFTFFSACSEELSRMGFPVLLLPGNSSSKFCSLLMDLELLYALRIHLHMQKELIERDFI